MSYVLTNESQFYFKILIWRFLVMLACGTQELTFIILVSSKAEIHPIINRVKVAMMS